MTRPTGPPPSDAHRQAAVPDYAVVIPTLGRPSLRACLEALARTPGPLPSRLVLVDDRNTLDTAGHADPRARGLDVPALLSPVTTVVSGGGRGPAAARNAGWRAAGPVPWIVFLDDDVVPGPSWAEDLARDLARAGARTAGVTARISVPLPPDRRPTDWERNTAGLATARWITADLAYRREALESVGGFDDRFRRAFREDADLALRLLDAGWDLAAGDRRTSHPVRPADRWVSLRTQAGNADDVLMTRLHGRDWWERAAAPRGRLPRHFAVTGAAVAAACCTALGRPRAAAVCASAWLAGTAEFAWARVAPGPRTRAEVAVMAATSVLIPPAACWHWLRGLWVHRRARPMTRQHPAGPPPEAHPARARTSEPVSS
ncbi:glycosyltransferase family 2 protein [Streptomyces sp. NPDC004244]|uniref:glycosyltransferase family 2 protein n=1 Tax=Streptomyces sp. NPDC101206 TaxID=3366128 RepID=UPI00380570AC